LERRPSNDAAPSRSGDGGAGSIMLARASRKGLEGLLAAAAAAAILVAGAREARADIALAVDADVAVPVDADEMHTYLTTGASFDLRLGYRFRIPYSQIAITPEVAGGYADLSSRLIRLRPGVRLAYGRVFVPYAYAHIGWGWTSFDPRGAGDTSPDPLSSSAQGASYDVGAGIDLAVLRLLTFGAHLGYNVVDVNPTSPTTVPAFRAKWMSFGITATLYL
jgi:hypothetical protein